MYSVDRLSQPWSQQVVASQLSDSFHFFRSMKKEQSTVLVRVVVTLLKSNIAISLSRADLGTSDVFGVGGFLRN